MHPPRDHRTERGVNRVLLLVASVWVVAVVAVPVGLFLGGLPDPWWVTAHLLASAVVLLAFYRGRRTRARSRTVRG